ncbi:lysophospholipid acyltransferase family protein [Coxiella burnetii]|uniref:Acyltransferase family protein n=2 Tax=Coxiella burnetii TaxID=777 RepID=Q83CD6_COXBU|nr:lysophospholipid acyltransferase family protein [Coxiella burnetii]NP_820179.1 acyltransferase family protein [Coxiella burnetii RSA 493]AAO90693.1 acyltransferase family protein [Coxiella burnetii RSA 493]ABS77670.1 acyltransferase family protein [Coxiella burnetii Dugway 5J108-111]ABX78402.1 acyltransferase [Coxiella burnetii RSA 331]ACJ20251.1 acyltransferase family protein [Coxiella burnetii CbuK_Q154]ARI65982.1 1-acyl-sn-glycerol-3-phosphate acyltransferase [Coxiella burnetii]
MRLQRVFSFLFLVPFYSAIVFYVRFVRRYKIKNKHKIRKQFRGFLKKEHKGPVLICANHLSYFDAFGIIWGLGSLWGYLRHFRRFPWNIPNAKFACANLFNRLMSYMGKMIPLKTEGGGSNAKTVLRRVTHLLKRGDFAMIFPEGTRSETGRLNMDDYGYGAGQILQAVPQAKVLLIYLRGEEDKMQRYLPQKGCQFYMKLKWFAPQTQTNQQGRQGIRELSKKIMEELCEMEKEYFQEIPS